MSSALRKQIRDNFVSALEEDLALAEVDATVHNGRRLDFRNIGSGTHIIVQLGQGAIRVVGMEQIVVAPVAVVLWIDVTDSNEIPTDDDYDDLAAYVEAIVPKFREVFGESIVDMVQTGFDYPQPENEGDPLTHELYFELSYHGVTP